MSSVNLLGALYWELHMRINDGIFGQVQPENIMGRRQVK